MQTYEAALAQHTKGLAGPYNFKCLLDVWLSIVKLPIHVYGPHYPVDCPNFLAAAQLLFPQRASSVELRAALLWLYRRRVLRCQGQSRVQRQRVTVACCFERPLERPHCYATSLRH